MKKILLTILLTFSFTNIVKAQTNIELNSKSAILIDYQTGKILYEHNKDEALAPASMTKIVSLLLVMESIEKKNISLDDVVNITNEASSMGGSQIFLEEGESYTVNELIKASAISSANDAIVALAIKTGGTLDNFIQMMNDKCTQIGCINSNFTNVHGLDDENHYSSSYDMAYLSKELLKYELILEYTSVYEEYLTRNDGSKTWLVNTNKLIRYYTGADGLKTGYTTSAGYCLTSTAKRNDFRVISVVMGSTTSEQRSNDTIKLLDYAFNSYKMFLIKSKEESLGNIKVLNANIDNIDIYLSKDAVDLKEITDDSKTYDFDINIEEIKAPYKSNDKVGTASIVDNEGNIVDTIDIIVKEDIKKANLKDYLLYNLKRLLIGMH